MKNYTLYRSIKKDQSDYKFTILLVSNVTGIGIILYREDHINSILKNTWRSLTRDLYEEVKEDFKMITNDKIHIYKCDGEIFILTNKKGSIIKSNGDIRRTNFLNSNLKHLPKDDDRCRVLGSSLHLPRMKEIIFKYKSPVG